MADLSTYLWRAKWLMLLAFAGLMALAALGAVRGQTTHVSTARVLFQVDAGQAVDRDQLLRLFDQEARLLKEERLIDQVLARFPPQRFGVAEAGKAREILRNSLSVQRPNRQGIFAVSIQHPDANLSSEALNAFIAAYLEARPSPHSRAAKTPASAEPDRSAELALLELDDEIGRFLEAHDVSDFDSERATAQALIDTLSGELAIAQSKARALGAQRAELQRRLQQTPKDIDLSTEDTTQKMLLELQLEREDLLARYTETSRAVESIDRRIAQVEAYLERGEFLSGTVQRGPNPVHMHLTSLIFETDAELQSYRRQVADLEATLGPIRTRLEDLNELLPQWTALKRKRVDLDEAVSRMRRDPVEMPSSGGAGSAAKVKLMDTATQRLEGAQRSYLYWALSVGMGLLAAFLVGLIYAVSRRGIATPSRMFRETGIPVIAPIGRH